MSAKQQRNKSRRVKPAVFVAMPFAGTDDLFKFAIRAAISKCGAEAFRIDREIIDGSILQQIQKDIEAADLVIGVMSPDNVNVAYEIGYAEALGKRLILIASDGFKLKFDLQHHQHIFYKTIEDCEAQLRRHIKQKLKDFAAPIDTGRELSEDFIRDFPNIKRIGDWKFDETNNTIVGEGMNSYLLSAKKYKSDYDVEAILSFGDFEKHKIGRASEFNAGIVFDWHSGERNPSYYNALITGSELLVERIGSNQTGSVVTDFQHLSAARNLKIRAGAKYNFHWSCTDQIGEMYCRNMSPSSLTQVISPNCDGRVGIRAWRCRMTVHKFTIKI